MLLAFLSRARGNCWRVYDIFHRTLKNLQDLCAAADWFLKGEDAAELRVGAVAQGSGFVPAASTARGSDIGKGLSQSGISHLTLRWDLYEQFWPQLLNVHHTRKAFPPWNAFKSVAMGIICCWCCFGPYFILFIADRVFFHFCGWAEAAFYFLS